MKKLLALFLVTLLSITLISCDKIDEIKEKISPDDKEEVIEGVEDIIEDVLDEEEEEEQEEIEKIVSASIANNEGETETLSANELIEIYNGNQAKFNKYYTGAEVNFTAAIESISLNQMTMISDANWGTGNTVVLLEGGWCLVNPPQDLADYMPGDKVQISAKIITAQTHMLVSVHGPANGVVWLDGTSGGIISDGGNKEVPSANSLKPSQLVEIFDANQARFNKYYTGVEVTKTGVIDSIALNQYAMKSDDLWNHGCTVVILEDGWCLVNPCDDIADLMPGDTVEFTGKIITAATHMLVQVHGPTGERVVWIDASNGSIKVK